MAEFKPGDRVMITTDFYSESAADYNGGNGTVVRKGCSDQCACGDYYEVLHDLDVAEEGNWEDSNPSQWTPYASDELTKID